VKGPRKGTRERVEGKGNGAVSFGRLAISQNFFHLHVH